VARHPIDGALKHLSDLPRREPRQLPEHRLVGELAVDAVEEDYVQVRVGLEVRGGPLHDDDRAALSVRGPLLLQPQR
jgi:hypothetical protein